MRDGNVRIVTDADELQEGLFGQVILYVFEILPYLHARGARPDWAIRAKYYGGAADGLVIPGVLDLAYTPQPAKRDVSLALLRERHCAQLGDDWQGLHDIWSSYFRIPPRIEAEADDLGPLGDALGVHYRGTDKLTAAWDTNPVSRADMAAIVADFRSRRPDLKRVFVASDDAGFASYLADQTDAEVINLGGVDFHKAEDLAADLNRKADRALLDCVLLSRCAAVLKTSSALGGFTKVLRPSLEIYRCAASKMFADIPYFPVAYVPRYQSEDPQVAAILERLMQDDWTDKHSQPSFAARPRYARRALKWKVLEMLGGSPV
ncbi:hypothetical protein [Phenylobacterium sp.]|uniref:hypothetical protein n=1 Tax=Phenylobacterium sp. TaxID=1871053 RepID=UPI00273322A4|nr:hypothetical protein [Phenylobacterium sp.]MDP3659080.1 hypothetical protein [Phenylobacterium sp.]